jgi:hypothetical protein
LIVLSLFYTGTSKRTVTCSLLTASKSFKALLAFICQLRLVYIFIKRSWNGIVT